MNGLGLFCSLIGPRVKCRRGAAGIRRRGCLVRPVKERESALPNLKRVQNQAGEGLGIKEGGFLRHPVPV